MTEYSQHRATTMATHGMVAAPHYLAAQAGLDLLKAGGNALDAAIAANAVLQVVFPQLVGLGGDLFLLLYDARSARLHALNASGRSARTATLERYAALGFASMPGFGVHSITVPGCADGWGVASERFGRLGLARALAPAITYAEEGFPVGPLLHRGLTFMSTASHTHWSFREHFLPDGRIPAAGSILRRPDLGRTLRAIADHGPDVFYRGDIGEQIAAFFAREGGLITPDDLAAHASDWVTPLHVPFAGLDIYELPPNTQGVTALQMLGMLDGLELGAGPLSPETVHVTVEAKKLAWADRAEYLGDPAHMRVDPEQMIAPEYLNQRRALLATERAQTSLAPGRFDGDTIYLCAADADGNAVSLIQSNYRGFGSGLVVDGTGIVLQNRGAYFSLTPDTANTLAPGKRPLHTLIPSMALKNDRPAVIFGTMGGDTQPPIHTQVYTALARYGLNIQAAIELPRWAHGAERPGEPEVLQVESRFPRATIAELERLGHRVVEIGPWDAAVGHAQGIVIDSATGVFSGGADPRAEGVAAGW
ncbi:MAG TPA: gamma-glutamyltransferase [Ktedonobacterales bacterium]|nr:gamma-glutamyltransferase [Ktedonobacterales bacterium]